MTVLVARAVGVNEFAAYALTIPSYVVFQRFWRVLILIPHQVAINQGSLERVGVAGAPVFRTVRVALFGSILTLAVASTVGGSYLQWGGLLALSLPLTAAYDAIRNTAFATERMATVVTMDLTWLLLQTIGSIGVVISSWNATWLALAWLIPPGLIAVVRFSDWDFRFTSPHTKASSKTRAADAVSDLFSSTLVAQAVPYIIAVLAAAPVAGAFRGAQTLTGPLNVLVMGLLPLLQNRSARSSHDPERVSRITRSAVFAFTGVSALYAVALALLPDFIGQQLLGDTWALTAGLISGVALLMCLRTPFLTITTSLRSLGRVRHIVVLRSTNAIGILVVAIGTAAFAPPTWIAPSMGLVSAATAAVAWSLLNPTRRGSTERRNS